MLCYVYPLRYMGTRRPVDEVLNASPWHGWLAFNRPHPWGQPETDAVLTRADERTRAMATLCGARVRRIEGGLLIDGQDQHIGRHPSVTAQVWAVGITDAGSARPGGVDLPKI